MPRTARASLGGSCYHVLNRGNGRAKVFHKEQDYAAFVALLEPACERLAMRILAYCLMPNHFHLVLRPHHDGDLSRWMQWLMTSHVRRYHRHYGGSGHVWQGRFKAFPIQEDEHLLAVLRYVERNPLRAKLVRKAQDWSWSSLRQRSPKTGQSILAASPVPLPSAWLRLVNEPQTEGELAALRTSVNRGTPFGGSQWTRRAATRLGLEFTLRPRGRPRQASKK
jgi:REP-associated tyrosine transposase